MAISLEQIVKVNPSVIATGANALAMNTVLLDNSAQTPIGSLLALTSQDDAAEFYGTGHPVYNLAGIYFRGFDNKTKSPNTLFVTGYANSEAAGWLRGASLAGMTLNELKAITGSLSVDIDGVTFSTSQNLDLSSVTGFSDAAGTIRTALKINDEATITWDAVKSAFIITSATTGATSTVSRCSGTAADALGLSAGYLSIGAAADTPSSAMERVESLSTNWSCVATTFNPDTNASDNANKELFAKWFNAQNNKYLYVAWDSSENAKVLNNPSAFGSVIDEKEYSGTFVVYNNAEIALFICGMIASIDWNAANGRIAVAFKSQSGLAPTVEDNATATAMLSNNTSYYGRYSGQGENTYNILYDGAMGGKWLWLDTYVNQIFLNAQLRTNIFAGLTTMNSVPYNDEGKTYIRAWCNGAIQQALINGTIRTGINLSDTQKEQIRAAAGLDITSEIETSGYYLQIADATPQVRQERGTPPVKLWYTDGGSIQKIEMASICLI